MYGSSPTECAARIASACNKVYQRFIDVFRFTLEKDVPHAGGRAEQNEAIRLAIFGQRHAEEGDFAHESGIKTVGRGAIALLLFARKLMSVVTISVFPAGCIRP